MQEVKNISRNHFVIDLSAALFISRWVTLAKKSFVEKRQFKFVDQLFSTKIIFTNWMVSRNQLTSTCPKIIPAPIVPMPAMKNGMATWIVVCHHFSCFTPVKWCLSPLSSPLSLPPPPSAPAPGSETKEVVVIELSDPVVDGGKTESLSSSPVKQKKRN